MIPSEKKCKADAYRAFIEWIADNCDDWNTMTDEQQAKRIEIMEQEAAESLHWQKVDKAIDEAESLACDDSLDDEGDMFEE